jgi:pyruvate dehydrogenase E1 component
VQLAASGVALPWALRAQEMLAQEWGVQADVWSATSWTELRREAVEVDRHNLLHPEAEPRVPHITRVLQDAAGPLVAVSDWMRAVPDLIRAWVPTEFVTLGTDGFGFSDTRPAARRHFLVDAESITVAALAALTRRDELDQSIVARAARHYRIDDPQSVGRL